VSAALTHFFRLSAWTKGVEELSDERMEQLEGTVERIIYQNDSNGYCVLELSNDQGEEITAVGTIPFVNPGELILLHGQWTNHISFGRQFKAESFERMLPSTESSIFKFLSSGAVKGIGKATAKKILDKFGSSALDIIETHSERLCEIRGISPKKAAAITESFQAQIGIRNVMLFLSGFGLSPETAVRVYKKWGALAVEAIRRDPYLLCDEIHGFTFAKADTIGQALGFDIDSAERLSAGIKYVLKHNLQNGHTYIPRGPLLAKASKLLGASVEHLEDVLEERIAGKDLERIHMDGVEAVFLPIYFKTENEVAQRLLQVDLQPALDDPVPEALLNRIEAESGILYAPEQKRAIQAASQCGVMVLTGCPGTGKTTTLRAIIRLFEHREQKVVLCAPTGRAAKRMSELCGREATTIHRLLEMEYAQEEFPRYARNQKNPLTADVIIVDETSMVDVVLMLALLRAMRQGTRLILVGDINQLLPVGAGNVLGNIIASELFSVVELTEIFRQKQGSKIVENAHAINRGELPDISNKSTDFFFLSRGDFDSVAETVIDLCKNRLPLNMNLSPFWDIQVLSPTRKTGIGTMALGVRLQNELNPPHPAKKEKKFRDGCFRVGDKVMQTRNNYEMVWEREQVDEKGQGIYNGDIGIIQGIDFSDETMQIQFDDRWVNYPFEKLEELELAYAITVHKSQGSEFNAVVMPVMRGAKPLMSRNLLYTAVTRAKTLVILVGLEQAVSQMVLNNRRSERYTGLCYFLRQQSFESSDSKSALSSDFLAF
jgi:exodeoxyribonuclease V alpha subunit